MGISHYSRIIRESNPTSTPVTIVGRVLQLIQLKLKREKKAY